MRGTEASLERRQPEEEFTLGVIRGHHIYKMCGYHHSHDMLIMMFLIRLNKSEMHITTHEYSIASC